MAASAVVMRGVCVGCGEEISVEIPPRAPAYVRAMAERRMEEGPLTECETCLALADRERDDVVQAAEREAAQASRRRLAALPVKWARQTFEGLEVDEPRRRAIELAQGWAAGEHPGLLLHGGVGRGKTAIAAAAANAMIARGRSVRWVPVAPLMMGLRSGFGTPAYEDALRTLDPGRGYPAVVLDDLDKLKPTLHEVEPIFALIDAWVAAELPLLVTLNRRLSELSDWLPEEFGDSIASRLRGYCKQREVGGVDRRTA